MISSFQPPRTSPPVTHLKFYNDTLLFCVAEEDQVKNVIAILICYEAVSRLKMNLFKSALIGISAYPTLVARLADIMGCEVGSLPTAYLGLPLSIAKVFKTLWNPVVERIERKFASWRARYLSLRGR